MIIIIIVVLMVKIYSSLSIEDIKNEKNKVTTLIEENISDVNENVIITPPWLNEALKNIAYYLRSHKFNEYDRRYIVDIEKKPKGLFYAHFPKPPLRSLHWEVHKHCQDTFIECIEYLKRRIKNVDFKRSDDTGFIMKENNWNFGKNLFDIKQVEDECRYKKMVDDYEANPFEGPIERFQWRVTASYYLCWYTMKSERQLQHLSEECDNFASCLDPELGSNNEDFRANDSITYACALYSFCPDPCCPLKHITDPNRCWNTPSNPCFAGNAVGQRYCKINRSLNMDFKWNVSCQCSEPGYEWSSLYGICIDVDECTGQQHNCKLNVEICINLPGTFKCVCRWGHILDADTKECLPSPALNLIRLQKEFDSTVDPNQEKNNNMIDDFYRNLQSYIINKSCSNKNKISILVFTILLVFVKVI